MQRDAVLSRAVRELHEDGVIATDTMMDMNQHGVTEDDVERCDFHIEDDSWLG